MIASIDTSLIDWSRAQFALRTNEFKRSENAAGEPVFWLAGAFENAKPIHADNDTLALDSGYASLVPCKIDVTDYDFLAVLKNQLKVES